MYVVVFWVYGGRLLVGVMVFVEGEEEFGLLLLGWLFVVYCDVLVVDVIVIVDLDNWSIDILVLMVLLCGMVDCVVEVVIFDYGLYFGLWGGVVFDVLIVLVWLLVSLYDDDGNVVVVGMYESIVVCVDYLVGWVCVELGLLDGVLEIGMGLVLQWFWVKLVIIVIGIDIIFVVVVFNMLIFWVWVKISIWVVFGGDVMVYLDVVEVYLWWYVFWGVQVIVMCGEVGQFYVIEVSGFVYDVVWLVFWQVWGVDLIDMGMGGLILFIVEFVVVFLQVIIFVIGVEDFGMQVYSVNESLYLGVLECVVIVEVLLLVKFVVILIGCVEVQ